MLQDILSGNISLFGGIIFIIALLIAITVHEFSHAWMADRLGDPTAKLRGRLTLNPLAHLDPLGTFLLLFIGFGWGKPVPIDPFNFRNPRKDSALASVAGSASNLILAVILSLFLRLSPLFPLKTYALLAPLNIIFYLMIRLNIMLAVFNLVPIHPLDGGKVLLGLVPQKKAPEVEDFLNKNSTLLLIFLLFPFFGSPLILKIILPIISFLLSLLLPGQHYI